MRVAIIGANGFVGRAVSRVLSKKGYYVHGFIRDAGINELPFIDKITYVSSADAEQDWRMLLADIDVVLHLASPIATDKANKQQVREYEEVIVDGSLSIAEAAVKNAVRRMIFISSTKVNGEFTQDEVFKTDSIPSPKTSYGKSKLQAELGLFQISRKKDLPLTVIRPPIVYGPGNSGNIYSMIKFLDWLPVGFLPLGGLKNKRSLIFIENLASAISRCVDDFTSESHVFFVRDPLMPSTTTLCSIILANLNKNVHLSSCNRDIIQKILTFFLPKHANRIFGSLEIDNSEILNTLGWNPPFNTEEGLRKTVFHIKQKLM